MKKEKKKKERKESKTDFIVGKLYKVTDHQSKALHLGLPLNTGLPLDFFSEEGSKYRDFNPEFLLNSWEYLKPGEVVMWLGEVKVTDHFKFRTVLWRGKTGWFGKDWSEKDLKPNLVQVNLPLPALESSQKA